MTFKMITQALVKRAPREYSIRRIATEAGVSPQWLSQFMLDRHKGANIDKVQAVHDYMMRLLNDG